MLENLRYYSIALNTNLNNIEKITYQGKIIEVIEKEVGQDVKNTIINLML
jgi:hypothetical protein